MLPTERHELILKELATHGSLTIADFAERVGFSGMTVRRDLDELAAKGILERVHGGAIPLLAPDAKSVANQLWTAGNGAATIGMLVPQSGYYFSGIIRGAEAAAAQLGVRLVLAVSNYSAADEYRQVKRLLNVGVNGLLVTPSSAVLDGQEIMELLSSAEVPVVIVERSIDEVHEEGNLEAVRSDHVRGAEIAVNHLISLGHQRIALLMHEGNPTAPAVAMGYRKALSRSSMPVNEAMIMGLPQLHEDPDIRHEMLPKIVENCLSGGATAMIVVNDEAAIQLTNVVLERGIDVPAAMSIVSYDDEVAALAEVPLTAVAPPKFDVGVQAVRTCFARMSGSSSLTTAAFQRINLSPILTVRESTGPVRPSI
ncbi:ribose/arabinose operon repressor [Arthrobacter sp. PAMC 25486]|nr:ribose/arabinose operon repressor [Arthrobacter sp. PAMC 25486]